jgi:hypothetical protein
MPKSVSLLQHSIAFMQEKVPVSHWSEVGKSFWIFPVLAVDYILQLNQF